MRLAKITALALNPTRLFLAIAPFLYVAYALITPPFQTPDEHQHLFRAYQLASFELIGERRGVESGGELPPSLVRSAVAELGTAAPHALKARPRTSFEERFSRATPLNAAEPPHFTNFLGSAPYSPAGYLTQIAAVWVGQALDMPVESIVRLGRVFNAALTIALLFAAFRTLPFGHGALLIIALLPMTAACAGSFGQDGAIIGASAWLVALSLRAIVNRRWQAPAAATAAALAIGVTLAKFVYLPLAALSLVPRPATTKWRQWAIYPLGFSFLAAIILAIWMHATSGLLVPMQAGMPSPGAQAAYILAHPSAFPAALADRYSLAHIKDLYDSLFTFGWLSVGPVYHAGQATFVAILLILWRGDEQVGKLAWPWRVWAIIIVVTIAIFLSLALYLAASPLGAATISGIQGRYFIPLALPALLALLRRTSRSIGDWPLVAAMTCMALANLMSLQMIAYMYYN